MEWLCFLGVAIPEKHISLVYVFGKKVKYAYQYLPDPEDTASPHSQKVDQLKLWVSVFRLIQSTLERYDDVNHDFDITLITVRIYCDMLRHLVVVFVHSHILRVSIVITKSCDIRLVSLRPFCHCFIVGFLGHLQQYHLDAIN